jgi:predicted DNA binding CopG/RHH family protein
MEHKRFDQISYQNNYIKEKYDRINLTTPRGRKEEIKRKSKSLGMSVNEYINKLIDEDLNRVKENELM